MASGYSRGLPSTDAWSVYVPSRPVSGTFRSAASVPKGESATLSLTISAPSGPWNTRSTLRPAGVSVPRAASWRKMPFTWATSPGR